MINVIDYVTIGSTGNATDFGDLTNYGNSFNGTSNGTRGVYQTNGGSTTNYFYSGSSIGTETLNYITIASTGNATDFGDRTIGSNDGGFGGSVSGA